MNKITLVLWPAIFICGSSCTTEIEHRPTQDDYARINQLLCIDDQRLQIAVEESAVPGSVSSYYYHSYWAIVEKQFEPSLDECGWTSNTTQLYDKVHNAQGGPYWFQFAAFNMTNFWEKTLFRADGTTTAGKAVLFSTPNDKANTINYYILMDYVYPE